jgi:4a-hydroxytetrahydrobiopterin dehydratase
VHDVRNADKNGLMPGPTPLESQLDARALDALLRDAEWTRDGESLTKTFRCKGWKAAIAFVDRIAVAADALNHHPDVHVESYRNVRIVTTTHATKQLSDADVALARRIDEEFARS